MSANDRLVYFKEKDHKVALQDQLPAPKPQTGGGADGDGKDDSSKPKAAEKRSRAADGANVQSKRRAPQGKPAGRK